MHWRTWHSKTVSSTQINIQVQCNSYQIPAGIFVDIDKIILQFMGKDEGTRVVKAILKKNNVGGISVPGSNISCSVERAELSGGSCLAAWSCPALCDPTDCGTAGFPVLHHLLDLAQTHVY